MKNLWILILVIICLLGCSSSPHSEPMPNQPASATQAVANTPEPPLASSSEPSPAATSGGEQPAYVPYFEPGACMVQVPASYSMACGFLVVPQDRSQPGGPTIRLPVSIFPSLGPDPAPDPVFHLVGGPGGNLIGSAMFYLEAGGERFLERRDYVLLNQRGTHYAEPSLLCPGQETFRLDLARQDLGKEERDAREIEFLLGCRETLVEQGINLAAYDSAAIAADVEDLRVALGYDQVNLYGISYGTRLALTILRDHPAGVRSVILDSVYPPQVGLDTEVAANANRAFTTLFEGCAADSFCSQRYPNLEEVFYQVVERLAAQPATVQLDSGSEAVYLDGDLFLEAIFGSFYRTEAIPWIPLMITQASNGNYDPLKTPLQAMLDESGISRGMYHTVQCREEVAFESAQDALDRASDVPAAVADHFAPSFSFTLCEAWQAGQAGPVENEPVTSPVPSLVLSGQYDPITPPSWGRLAAATLENSYFYEFPGIGHGVMRSDACALEIGLQFLDDPSVEPDASCINALAPPEFK
jgi:pimeloyl-ACP methyl ester carboxylesterase